MRKSALALALFAAAGLGLGLYLALAPSTSRPREPRLVWMFEPPERGAIIASPLVTATRVYAAAIEDNPFVQGGAVYCLERETGKLVWKFDDDGAMKHMYSSPGLADGRLYIGEGMHANFVCNLYCLDAATGRKHWQFTAAGHIESSPCLAAGRVYFGAGDDGLYCLDAVSGKEIWHFRGPFHIDSSPAVLGTRVYVGAGVSAALKTTAALCLNAATGALVWRTPTDLPVWGSPRLAANRVYFGLGNGRLVRSADPPETPAGALLCLDTANGAETWRHDVSDGVLARCAIDATRVYFGDREGFCHCLDRVSGDLCWKRRIGSAIVTEPALADDRVYLTGSAGDVCCLSAADGRELWRYDVAKRTGCTGRLFSSPVAAPEGDTGRRRLFFGTELRSAVSAAAVLYCLED